MNSKGPSWIPRSLEKLGNLYSHDWPQVNQTPFEGVTPQVGLSNRPILVSLENPASKTIDKEA
jgi:hypothetical protein